GQHVSGRIGNGHDGVIKRRLNVGNGVGNVLAFLALELLFLALFLRCRSSGCWCGWLSHSLCLRCRFLFLRNGALAWPLAGTCVGVGALPTNWQVAAVAKTAVRPDFDQPLDVHGGVLA